jgi:hypothetical protein
VIARAQRRLARRVAAPSACEVGSYLYSLDKFVTQFGCTASGSGGFSSRCRPRSIHL